VIDDCKGPEDKLKGSMPNKGAAAGPIYTKKENATLEQRIEIINWHNANGKNQSKTARHFNPIYPNLKIKQPLIHSWVTHQDKWQREWAEAQARGAAPTMKRARQTQHPDVTEMMDLWVSKAMTNGILVTGETLRQKWRSFADLAGVPDDEHLTLSEGWLSCFKKRTNLKQLKRHGEAGSAEPATVERERQRIRDLLGQYDYQPKDIFNMDETGFFYAHVSFSFLQILSLISMTDCPQIEVLLIRNIQVSKAEKSD
jgi:hypothetical protein